MPMLVGCDLATDVANLERLKPQGVIPLHGLIDSTPSVPVLTNAATYQLSW